MSLWDTIKDAMKDGFDVGRETLNKPWTSLDAPGRMYDKTLEREIKQQQQKEIERLNKK